MWKPILHFTELDLQTNLLEKICKKWTDTHEMFSFYFGIFSTW